MSIQGASGPSGRHLILFKNLRIWILYWTKKMKVFILRTHISGHFYNTQMYVNTISIIYLLI